MSWGTELCESRFGSGSGAAESSFLELQRRRGSVVAFSKIYNTLMASFCHYSDFRILTKEGQRVRPRADIQGRGQLYPDSDDEDGSDMPPPPPPLPAAIAA